jgi:hypothetical protein
MNPYSMKQITTGLLLSLMIGLSGCTVVKIKAEDQVEVDQKKNCGRAMTQRTKCD